MTMRASPAKFLFDQDFSAADGKPSMTLAEHTATVAEAEMAGFARGLAQAKADAKADADQRIAAELAPL